MSSSDSTGRPAHRADGTRDDEHGTAETDWRDDLERTTADEYEHGSPARTPGTPGSSGPSAATGTTDATPGTPGPGGTTATHAHGSGTTDGTTGAPGAVEEAAESLDTGTTEGTPGAPARNVPPKGAPVEDERS
jgi:hypothetical protein